MKKNIFLIFVFLMIYQILCSQTNGSQYRIRINTSLYTDCNLNKFVRTLYNGTKVITTSPICTDNTLLSKVISIKPIDNNIPSGWIFFEDLISSEAYGEDSLQIAIKTAKQIEKVRKSDSIRTAVQEIEKRKNDSINAAIYKFLHTKTLWITELYAYDYTDRSAGISVKFFNSSKKTIKYINFTAIPYNRVNDPVIDNMGNSTKVCKLIGPIDPDTDATYKNDILFFSGVVDYYKLKNISVQYMDNTVKYFNYSDILLDKNYSDFY